MIDLVARNLQPVNVLPCAMGSRDPPGKISKTLPATDTSTLSGEVAHAIRAPHLPVLVVISARRWFAQGRSIARFSSTRPDLRLGAGRRARSSRHALIEDRRDSWTLVDLGSTNGTSVNGHKGADSAFRATTRS